MHQAGRVLKQLMSEADIDESTLSALTSVSKSNISRLKNDNNSNPTLATLQPIAAFFGVSVSELLGESPLLMTANSSSPHASYFKRVPLLAWSDITACPKKDRQHKTTSWVSTDMDVSEGAFAIQIKDSTLGPRFPLGAILVIETQLQIKDGDTVLVQGKNEPYLRQVVIDGDHFLLRSLKLGTSVIDPLLDMSRVLGSMVEMRIKCKVQDNELGTTVLQLGSIGEQVFV